MPWSALERAILSAYHTAWAHRGFPAPEAIRLRKRQRTDLGWFLLLECDRRCELPDWDCPLPDDECLMVELTDPASLARVTLIMMDGRPMTLELCRLSGAAWPADPVGWTLSRRTMV
jgi:hypothetical protein